MSDFEKSINASDLIDWIMCAYSDWCVGDVRGIIDHVNEMPSTEPEIIRCRDCKHYMTIHCVCDGCCISDDWYCAGAERKTDGVD